MILQRLLLFRRPRQGHRLGVEPPQLGSQAERKQREREVQKMIGYEVKLLDRPSSVISCTADEDGPFPSSVGPAVGCDHLPACSGNGLIIYPRTPPHQHSTLSGDVEQPVKKVQKNNAEKLPWRVLCSMSFFFPSSLPLIISH